MAGISSVVERALKKHVGEDIPLLRDNLSSSLELRLVSNINSKRFREAKKIFLGNYLNEILTLSLGNVSLAAKRAGINRRHLHRMLEELELDPGRHRKALVKPGQYLKENVQLILEETLSLFSRDIEKLKPVYSNIGDISEIVAKNIGNVSSYGEALYLFEKDFLERALRENRYDVAKTAESIDISERTLYRKISRLNLATI